MLQIVLYMLKLRFVPRSIQKKMSKIWDLARWSTLDGCSEYLKELSKHDTKRRISYVWNIRYYSRHTPWNDVFPHVSNCICILVFIDDFFRHSFIHSRARHRRQLLGAVPKTFSVSDFGWNELICSCVYRNWFKNFSRSWLYCLFDTIVHRPFLDLLSSLVCSA